MRRQRPVRQFEHPSVPAQPHRDHDHRCQHHPVQHHVFHNRNHRRSSQTARVGVRGQHHEGRPPAATRHGFPLPRSPPGCRTSCSAIYGISASTPVSATATVSHRFPYRPPTKIRKRHVPVPVAHRPHSRQHQHHVRVRNHGVWPAQKTPSPPPHTVPPAPRSPCRPCRGRRQSGNHVTHVPEASPCQPPLFQRGHSRRRPTPPRRPEARRRVTPAKIAQNTTSATTCKPIPPL